MIGFLIRKKKLIMTKSSNFHQVLINIIRYFVCVLPHKHYALYILHYIILVYAYAFIKINILIENI